nr:MAG TPA: hypothetical protein [Bacteriophage sp.]
MTSDTISGRKDHVEDRSESPGCDALSDRR